jgi:beta-glucanase (GH16 family)
LFVGLLLVTMLFGGFGTRPGVASAAPPRVVDGFEAALRSGSDANGIPVGFFTAQDGASAVAFRTTNAPPAPVPDLAAPNNVLRMDFSVSAYGVVIHGFENDAANTWVSQDWSAYEGIGFWLYGNNSGTDLFVDIIDNRNPGSTRDDAERYTVTFKDDFSGWKFLRFPFSGFARKEIGNGAPADGFTLTSVHGWAFGTLTTSSAQTYYLDNVTLSGAAPERPVELGFAANAFTAPEGRTARVTVKLSKAAASPVTVRYTTAEGSATANRDYIPAQGTLTFAPGVVEQSFTVTTLDDTKFEGDEVVLLRLTDASGAQLGLVSEARLAIKENDTFDPALIDDFERAPDLFTASERTQLKSVEIAAGSPLALPGQGAYERVLEVTRHDARPASFDRRFAQGEDWSGAQGLQFWFYGRNSGKDFTVRLQDNQATDPGPAGWRLAWSDEFNGAAGAAPDPSKWSYDIGDGTANGNPGWGNNELQYYTDSTENAATDGAGNLLITAKETGPNSTLHCYYGPCKYTSARLLSWHKAEFAHGRIEARIRVPRGAGLWPAFWALGTDIDRVGWPRTGEIDIMEHVARLPKRVFGTIHGPGYSGANAYGRTYDLAEDVANAFHNFAVEWTPDRITWYVDGIAYHTATPADVAPNQWVYNHPFFLLLNMAVGGNFGGAVGADTTFPQAMAVDYVRVYQAPDTAERWEASFTDNFTGWQRVTVPFTAFTRSKEKAQPLGAPNDGLNLTSVWGYGFGIPASYRDAVLLDQARLKLACPDAVTVTSTADSGAGSLRQALADVCAGGTISFAPNLTGATIGLSSGELTIARNVTIDGAGAPGLVIGGGDKVRVLVVNAKTSATIRGLTIANGYGWELAGGILNNGMLTLERVTVAKNRVDSSGNDYWKGGAGIYNGGSGTLNLIDSTVRDNVTTNTDGGGVYAFLGSLTTVERSTISGNTAGNVGGGMRVLGDAEITNSTISGNRATAWHGGAIFHTDGAMSITNSTIANNTAPDGASGGAFVGAFTAGSSSLALANSIVAGNTGDQCFVGRFGAGAVSLASGGHNLAGDGTCGLTSASDKPATDPRLGPLAANGGPTATHALLSGSPAIDAADAAVCPATDQRGVRRPQGSGCDIGAYEAEMGR